MRKLYRSVILSCALLAGGAAALPSYASAATSQPAVKVQINDSLVQFGGQQPFVDGNDYIVAPIRKIAEELGYTVTSEKAGAGVKVTLSDGQHEIAFYTGNQFAWMDGSEVYMGTKAKIEDGTTFVPLKFISQASDIEMVWNGANRIGILNEDGEQHAPAWIAPKQAPLDDKVIQTATRYLGVPYVWGGTSPSGFDCSGFVQYVFKKNGVLLPRTQSVMYVQSGTKVAQPVPGDLVFFKNGGSSTSHVGIYLGSKKFISATNSSGISVDSLSSSYWGKRYVGAKRVSN